MAEVVHDRFPAPRTTTGLAAGPASLALGGNLDLVLRPAARLFDRPLGSFVGPVG